ncbi:MAG: NUDIX domain-containing protein [Pseudomonadota bacterium]
MTIQFPTAAPAATVILTRPAEAGIEVYLLKRSATSSFMAGNYVFPGGMVDDVDAGDWSDLVDMDHETIKRRLGGGLAVQDALTYGVAAIRETFEEAGVLLARQTDSATQGFERARRQRETDVFKEGWFRSLVTEHQFCLQLTGLFRWAHWVTPREMKRHYDTRFFVAAMPPDQTCRPDARETTAGVWISPLAGLKANLKGEISLSPPAIVTLQAFSKFKDYEELQEVITKRPWGEPLRPRFITMGKDAVIVEPWDPEFEQSGIDIDRAKLGDKLLPVASDFSRIWLHGGVWRPVEV